MNRRNFLIGTTASLFCAPAIVRAQNIMPVKSYIITPTIAEEFYARYPYAEKIGFALIDENSAIPEFKEDNTWMPMRGKTASEFEKIYKETTSLTNVDDKLIAKAAIENNNYKSLDVLCKEYRAKWEKDYAKV